MGNDIRKKVDFPLYLEVLKQLPEVSNEDIAETKEVFEKAYGELPDNVTFDIGGVKGDGEIYAKQRIVDDAGRSIQTKLYIDEYGNVENRDTGYEGEIPFLVARYFIASLFGTGELEETEGIFFKSSKLEGLVFKQPIAGSGPASPKKYPFNPNTNSRFYIKKKICPLLIPHVGALAEGAKALYEDAVKKGSLGAMAKSEGAKQIEGVKAQIMAQLHLMTQAVWNDAEAIKKDSKKKDGVEAAMKQYGPYKPDSPALTYDQAMERYEMAVEMIRNVAAVDEKGFKDECCEEVEEVKGKASKIIKYECDYGVNGGKEQFFGAVQPWG